MKKHLIPLMISALTLTSLASAASVSSTSNLGEGFHLITSAVGQCTGAENCTIPYGNKVCDADNLGVVYRMATPNPDGSYAYEDQKCIWGDDSQWIVDTYTVTKGGEDFSCPVVAAGPLTSTTNNWPPTRFWGLTPEQFVYCTKSR
ncbi:hypothetical protein [Deinococcus cellulosilyticus]|uniref:Secreted protein n=1 Tax=Deinococcus cellulosilyticus (strain DSM 18568 / NBRC 106333 / KACC 11606 / 5516J-15) TaxID=1223518 RepID=A0A511MW34_DEIC1|nr:hypothetical protein [Deinococcus cellulosilyticus]GEM44387.1 hypothetical protein DC3_00220 [Deinococcus cellulosilyticus NBRC 106333 = KACC 11606]